MKQSFDQDSHKGSILLYLYKPEILSQFTAMEARDLLVMALDKTYLGAIKAKAMKTYMEKGMLSQDEIVKAIITKIPTASTHNFHLLKDILALLSEENQLAIKQVALDHLLRSGNVSLLYGAKEIGIINDSNIAEIFRALIKVNPHQMLMNFDELRNTLPAEEVKNYIAGLLKEGDDWLYYNLHIIEYVMKGEEFNDLERKEFLDKGLSLDKSATNIMEKLNSFLSYIPQSQRREFVLKVLENCSSSSTLNYLDLWLNIVSEDPHEQKGILEKIIKKGGFGFIEKYNDLDEKFTPLRTLFGKDEILGFIRFNAEIDLDLLFYQLKPLRTFFGSDPQLKEFILSFSAKGINTLFFHFEKIVYLLSEQDTDSLLEQAKSGARGLESAAYSIDKWSLLLGQEKTEQFIEYLLAVSPIEAIGNLEKIISFIPENNRKDFVIQLIREGLPLALYDLEFGEITNGTIKKYTGNLTIEQIIELGMSNKEVLSFPSKILDKFFKDIQKIKDPHSRRLIIQQAFHIYSALYQIRFHNLTEEIKLIFDTQPITASQEQELITTFRCFALLKQKNPQEFMSKFSYLGSTVEESKAILMNELISRMGLDRQITDTEIRRFYAVMETPVPFISYYIQFEDSTEHRHLLKQIFVSILDGKFKEWEFGSTPELLPNISQPQYEIWCKDDESSLFESLSTTTERTATEIKQYLEQNLEHIFTDVELQAVGEIFEKSDKPETVLEEAQREIVNLGPQIAAVNTELSRLKKSDTGANEEKLRELIAQKEDLESARNTLLKLKHFLRLTSLKSAEIASGQLIEGAEGKKGMYLENVLKEFSKLLADGFVVSQVANMLQSFSLQNKEKQNLICTDSSSPKVWIEIGEKPVSTCQHYATGSHNDCLLGYIDPNTKFLILRNNNGVIIGRSIFRLLADNNGNPALHLERIYSSSTSEGVTKAIYTHALKKAAKMGLPLYISHSSQNEAGMETKVKIPDGFEAAKTNLNLISKASRAPKVYVDSAGGERTRGNFVLKNVLQLSASV